VGLIFPDWKQLLSDAGHRTRVHFKAVFADGSSFQNGKGKPEVILIFRNRKATVRTALFHHVGLVESYFYGDLDVEGSLGLAFRIGLDAGLAPPPTGLLKLRNAWHELRFSNASIA